MLIGALMNASEAVRLADAHKEVIIKMVMHKKRIITQN
jgi:hypothetical protein